MDYIETVQQAQARFAETDRCARLVTITDNLAYPANDAWHYDTEGYLRLGAAFAAAVLELQRTCPQAD
jgi:hypothetical protein